MGSVNYLDDQVNTHFLLQTFFHESEKQIIDEFKKVDNFFSPNGSYKSRNDWKAGKALCTVALKKSQDILQKSIVYSSQPNSPENQQRLHRIGARTKIFGTYFEKEAVSAARKTWGYTVYDSWVDLATAVNVVGAICLGSAIGMELYYPTDTIFGWKVLSGATLGCFISAKILSDARNRRDEVTASRNEARQLSNQLNQVIDGENVN
jgi:hypothetical protein